MSATENSAVLPASLGLDHADPALTAAVIAGLAKVEDVLRTTVHSDVDYIDDAALHLVRAGGKRFRPLFTLVAAEFGTGATDEVIAAAAAVELVHLATLYHDDVMDEATMRRGDASANARWSNSIAILTGDFLFAHASMLVADLGPAATRVISETMRELVTGQMRETIGARGADPIEHYLSVIAQKTGSLIATAGRFGAMFAGAPIEHTEVLQRVGEVVGAAFQLSDDVIDIASPAAESGKMPGTDLREGVRTLPMLYALADDPDPRLVSLLDGPITDEAALQEALDLLRKSPGLERARQTLDDYTARADAELAILPESPAREALHLLTRYVVERTH
ncbi:polyprenyl synthetase family protein [Actinokineospora sp. 24-640]